MLLFLQIIICGETLDLQLCDISYPDSILFHYDKIYTHHSYGIWHSASRIQEKSNFISDYGQKLLLCRQTDRFPSCVEGGELCLLCVSAELQVCVE